MNEEERSGKYYAQLAEHRIKGDANEAHAEGMIYPQGEPVERTGKYADVPQLVEEEPER